MPMEGHETDPDFSYNPANYEQLCPAPGVGFRDDNDVAWRRSSGNPAGRPHSSPSRAARSHRRRLRFRLVAGRQEHRLRFDAVRQLRYLDRSLHRRKLAAHYVIRSEEHTSELQSLTNLVCRLLLEKKKPTES